MNQPHLPQLENWTPLATAQGVFAPGDCAKILELRGTVEDVQIIGEGESEARQAGYRKGRVSWIRPGPANEWIFSKTYQVIQQVNQECYRMELSGFTEPLQVAEYGAENFYTWHLDVGRGAQSIRKLSFIVQLTDPGAYQGGEVELLCSDEPLTISRNQGAMTVFPSYLLHRVKAVSAGRRHSLVGWIGGPHLR